MSEDARIERKTVAKSALAVYLIVCLQKPATPQNNVLLSYAFRRFSFKAKIIDIQTFSGNPPGSQWIPSREVHKGFQRL